MLNNEFWKSTFEKQAGYDISRRKIIGESSRAQQSAKQAIFSLQRGNFEEGEQKLRDAEDGLISLDQRFGQELRLRMEGSWKAGIEEYVEAKLFYYFIKNEQISEITGFHIEPDEYVGGLSDLTGEILRQMIIWTTRKEFDKVKAAGAIIEEVLHELIQHNFSGYMRTKFDQAKVNLHKSEQVLYDLSIREK